mgnify:CR=1 FL=1
MKLEDQIANIDQDIKELFEIEQRINRFLKKYSDKHLRKTELYISKIIKALTHEKNQIK